MTSRRSSKQNKPGSALPRAIKKSDPLKEPPTVGKPVIVDPAPDGAKGDASNKRPKKTSSR
jgi:hypothetical protein